MPALKLKSMLWIGLLIVLLLAVTPRPAAATVKDCSPETGATAPSVLESEEAQGAVLAAEPRGTPAEDPENTGNKTGGVQSPAPAAAHRPRTSWPELVPLGN